MQFWKKWNPHQVLVSPKKKKKKNPRDFNVKNIPCLYMLCAWWILMSNCISGFTSFIHSFVSQTVPEFKTNGFLYTLWSLCTFPIKYMILLYTFDLKTVENRGLSCTVGQLYQKKQLAVSQETHTYTHSQAQLRSEFSTGRRMKTFTELQWASSFFHRLPFIQTHIQTATGSKRRFIRLINTRSVEIWGHTVFYNLW